MRKEVALGLVLAAGASAVLAAVAIAAPTVQKPPSISGKPNFDSALTCHKGTWSSDAVHFSYAWTYAGGGPQIATRRTWRADAARLGYGVVCQVTAFDASGASASADSPQVVIAPGISTVRITKIRGAHGSLTVTGVVGPRAALVPSKYAKPYIVLDRRLNKTTVTQLTGLKILTNRSGRFKITAPTLPAGTPT